MLPFLLLQAATSHCAECTNTTTLVVEDEGQRKKGGNV